MGYVTHYTVSLMYVILNCNYDVNEIKVYFVVMLNYRTVRQSQTNTKPLWSCFGSTRLQTRQYFPKPKHQNTKMGRKPSEFRLTGLYGVKRFKFHNTNDDYITTEKQYWSQCMIYHHVVRFFIDLNIWNNGGRRWSNPWQIITMAPRKLVFVVL